MWLPSKAINAIIINYVNISEASYMAPKKGQSTRGNSQRNTSKKRTTSSKASTSRKKEAANVQNEGFHSELRNEAIILLLFAFTFFLALCNLNLVGVFGAKVKWLMFGLFGLVQYIIPFIIAGCIVFILANKDLIKIVRIKVIAIGILTILICAFIQRGQDKPPIDESGIGEIFTYSAENYRGGGFVGGLICKLLSPLDFVGTMLIIIILAILCFIVITEKSLVSSVKNMSHSGKRIVDGARDDYSAYREHYARKRVNEEKREHEGRKEQKEQKEQDASNYRMNKSVKGVTSDTVLSPNGEEEEDNHVDIDAIEADRDRVDEYSDDIYDPQHRAKSTKKKEMGDVVEIDPTIHGLGAPNYEPIAYSEEEIEGESQFENLFGSYSDEKPEEIQEIEEVKAPDNSMESEVYEGEVITEEKTDDSVTTKPKKNKPYKFPPISLLNKNPGGKQVGASEYKQTANKLRETLMTFGVNVTVTDVSCGPSVTRYELQPEQGVKVSKIVSLTDDIKLNLAAADIRIEAPIPGKAAIGIEVPNKEAGSVFFRELIESNEFKSADSPVTFGAGKDIAGKTIVADIAEMPHMLIAGATGSGKSVCINTIIMSILYKAKPEDVRLIMVDPKVVELSIYNGIPHLLLPVVTDPKKAAGALNWAVREMDDRYKKFAAMQVRNIKGYNELVEKKNREGINPPMEKLPFIVIIIDELADLMMVAPGEVEDSICRLAQLARAAGIHMIVATQRPSVNVVTGLIKANIPSKIAFAVSSGTDSRVILDMNGAEKLLGKGDMLYFPAKLTKPLRVQGAFVSDKEVEAVVNFLKDNTDEVSYDETITDTASASPTSAGSAGSADDERDSLFEEAGRYVIESEKGSIGSLQRHFKIGFNRAGRIMDQLADAKVVGPELGTKPRKVEMTVEEFEALLKNK